MDTTKMRVMSCMGIGVVIYWEYHVANISVPPDPPRFCRWVFCFVAYGGLRELFISSPTIGIRA